MAMLAHTCGHSQHLLIDLRPALLGHICQQLLPLPLELLGCLGRLALLEVLLHKACQPSCLGAQSFF